MRLNIKLVLCWLITCIHLNSVAMASLQDGLLGHWKLDEEAGNIAKDSSGKSNHGKLTAGGKGTTWKPGGGKVGGALYFDGSGEQVADDRGKEYINGLTALLMVEIQEATIRFWALDTIRLVLKLEARICSRLELQPAGAFSDWKRRTKHKVPTGNTWH